MLKLAQNSLLGEVLASGLYALSANPYLSEADLRSTLEQGRVDERHKLERYLAALATIASAAPLLGLPGTVIGMIEIFGSQSASSGNARAAAIRPNWRKVSYGAVQHRVRSDGRHTRTDILALLSCPGRWLLAIMELSAERFVRHLNTLRK